MRLQNFIMLIFIALNACSKDKDSPQTDLAKTNETSIQNATQSPASPTTQVQRSGSTKNPLVDEFIGLIAEISQRAPSLARTRDVNGKLRNMLKTNIGYACMLDLDVTQIEIKITGSDLNSKEIPCNETTGSSLSSSNYRFTFKNSQGSKTLVFINDESSNKLFSSDNSKIFIPEPNSFKIFDFETVTIEKIGNNIINTSSGCSETNRTSLNGLQIKANNQVIYNNGSLNHTFEEATPTWSDENFQINTDFINLKRIEDCTSYQ